MMNHRKWAFTTEDISVETGRSVRSVRSDIKSRVFDPCSLGSLSMYVAARIMERKARDDSDD